MAADYTYLFIYFLKGRQESCREYIRGGKKEKQQPPGFLI